MPTPPIANVPGAPGYQPPIIWGGGNEPFPTPPIANVPGAPSYRPPGFWGPQPGFPTPPIYLPPKPDTKPPVGETGSPENPIELPPNDPQTGRGHWQLAYFPALNGWIWVWIPESQMPPHVEHLEGKKK